MNTFEVFTGIFGGLGLFLYGMKLMSDGLENAAGTKLKSILERITSNRIIGVAVGAMVTAIIQSSSATTVMVVSFVNAGLMSLMQAAGVIMGANIGTTITAQMVSLKLDHIAPIFIGLGAILLMIAKKKRVKDIATISLGFGILFMGMGVMSGALQPIADASWFKDFVIVVGDNAILGLLAGLAMTAVVQSSSATTGILVAFATTGAISLNVAFPIILGCNIGTCVTALLAALGANRTAKKASLIHLFFNIGGTLIFLPIYKYVVDFVQYISPDSVARQIANAHTIFNVVVTLIMLPLAAYLVMLVNKVMPGDEAIEKEGAMYLDKKLLETPVVASEQVIKETVRMGKTAQENLKLSMQAFMEDKEDIIKKVYENENIINVLERDITDYLVELSQNDLPEQEAKLVSFTYHAINDIERIGDHAENIADLASYKINNHLKLAGEAKEEIKNMYNETLTALDMAINNYAGSKIVTKEEIENIEVKIDDMEKTLRKTNMNRLNTKECYPETSVLFLDLISNLERIGDHANNIGKARLGN